MHFAPIRRSVIIASLSALAISVLACLDAGSALAAPRVAYVANYQDTGQISIFSISSHGLLASDGSGVPTAGDEPWYSAITPNGRDLYVTNNDSSTVAQFRIGSSGGLSPLSPGTVSTGDYPTAIAVSPDGKSVYVADWFGDEISQFSVSAGGELVPKHPAVVNLGAESPGLAISPNGRWLYALEQAQTGSIEQLRIGSGGRLSGTPVSSAVTGAKPDFVALTPDGRHAYVANYGDGTVSAFAVTAAGALKPIGSPQTAGVGGENLYSLTISPAGRSLYAPNDMSIFQFSIRPDGTLAPKAPASAPGGGESENIWFGLGGLDAFSANYDDGAASTVSEWVPSPSGALVAASVPSIAAGSGPATVMIAPDQAPTAALAVRAGAVGRPTRLSGVRSHDPDGKVVQYAWSFGDGSHATTRRSTVAHVYRRAGRYAVTLTVTDDGGCSTRFVFTGQTAYCNGGPSAKVTKRITVR